jgi:hypothetical protein
MTGIGGVPFRRKSGLVFLAGYIDCVVYDAGKTQLADAQWNVLEVQISKYYSAHASEIQTPVAVLLMRFGNNQGKNAASGGESYPGKHGMFDGEYWRQVSPDHRLGFLEGYLECQKENNKPAATFSRSAVWYVAQISQWLGVKADDPSEVNPKRVDKKIANALYLLRDKATTSSAAMKQP